ncbi:hypothetical protein [Rickettsiella endosymbiont of Miltochrista miniata]|uniref:hypothetical protein n=1 Tax=Rickettsiella endosymbiont of Miltochrista miniata TaxID=3066239 RepID=UPI00313D6EC9
MHKKGDYYKPIICLIFISNITVQNLPSSEAIGLEATGSAQMQMNLGSLSVAGDDTSQLTEGSNISLNLVSCTFNGGAVAC